MASFRWLQIGSIHSILHSVLNVRLCGWLSWCLLGLGCAPSTLYHWGDYEHALYDWYKHPGRSMAYQQAVADTIERAEGFNQVPPGLYAEHGFMLLQSKQYAQAIVSFEQERQRWPESTMLMNKMIESAQLLSQKNATVNATVNE